MPTTCVGGVPRICDTGSFSPITWLLSDWCFPIGEAGPPGVLFSPCLSSAGALIDMRNRCRKLLAGGAFGAQSIKVERPPPV